MTKKKTSTKKTKAHLLALAVNRQKRLSSLNKEEEEKLKVQPNMLGAGETESLAMMMTQYHFILNNMTPNTILRF